MTLHHALRAMQHGASYDADAAAYIASASELFPSALNDFVVGCKADSTWSLLGSFKKAVGVPSLAASMIDLRNTAFNGTAVNAPTQSATAGWTFVSASSQYINSGWKPSAGSSGASQNSAHMGLRLRAVSGSGFFAASVSDDAGAGGLFGLPVISDGFTFYNVNDNGSDDVTTTPMIGGHIIAIRTGASAKALYRNTTSLDSVTTASSLNVTKNVFIGATNTEGTSVDNYSDGRATCVHFGAALNSTQEAAIIGRINTYMTAAGET